MRFARVLCEPVRVWSIQAHLPVADSLAKSLSCLAALSGQLSARVACRYAESRMHRVLSTEASSNYVWPHLLHTCRGEWGRGQLPGGECRDDAGRPASNSTSLATAFPVQSTHFGYPYLRSVWMVTGCCMNRLSHQIHANFSSTHPRLRSHSRLQIGEGAVQAGNLLLLLGHLLEQRPHLAFHLQDLGFCCRALFLP